MDFQPFCRFRTYWDCDPDSICLVQCGNERGPGASMRRIGKRACQFQSEGEGGSDSEYNIPV